MKEKIFLFASKVVSFFPISWEVERKISNIANLVCFVLKNGCKYTFRFQALLDISSDFFENHLSKSDVNEKIVRLKKNLDETSRIIVDTNVRRHKYVYTHNLLDNREIYNQEELKKQKVVKSFQRKNKRYFPICDYPETYYYHNGLILLPSEIIERISDKDVIDGGAFNGDSALILSKKYSFQKILSFEPDELNFKELKKNIAKYKMGNVEPINKGLSYREGKVNFTHQGVSSSIQSQGKEEIEVVVLDKYLDSQIDEPNIGLIKFDIEGAEFDALVGSIETIKKFRPVLLISIYHNGKDFFEILPWLENFDFGYKFKLRKLNPNSSVGEIMLIAYVP
jgi:FkbM family methyltransferase